MKQVNVRPVFCGPVHLNIRLAGHQRYIIIKDINAFSRIGHLAVSIRTGNEGNDDRRQKTARSNDGRQPNFGFDIFYDHKIGLNGYKKLPEALRATAITVPAPLPKLEVAEVIPDVEIIQVEMLGTVNIQMAPITKTIITVPNDKMPLPAKTAILAISAAVPVVPTSTWYLLISDVSAYCCINPHKYMIR